MPAGPVRKLTKTATGRVFVLVKAAPAMIQSLCEYIPTIQGVTLVSPVTGAYDLIVVIEGSDIQRILGVILKSICQLEGVRETQTLIEAKL